MTPPHSGNCAHSLHNGTSVCVEFLPSASREFGTHINFSLCLCIFIIMDFIAVNNSSDKYKMSCRGKQDSRSTRNDAAVSSCACACVVGVVAATAAATIVRGQLFSFSVVQCTLSLASFTSNEMLNFVFRFSFSHNFTPVRSFAHSLARSFGWSMLSLSLCLFLPLSWCTIHHFHERKIVDAKI